MPTNKEQEQQVQMTPQQVQQAISSIPAATPNMTNPNGYNAITPVTGTDGTPRGSAWRNVQQTGNAKTDYEALRAQSPLAYQNPYQQQATQTLNNLLGQQPFNYNVNTDALYQQIKDNYIRQGRQAMMDTQGQSAALTGGYGNSYGVLAGQQAYQESLGNLANQIPELYNLAYQRYQGNEASQRQNLAALQGLDETEYQRYNAESQMYEAKLADAYAKYKAASAGSGGKKLTYAQYKQYVEDAMAWADQTGGDVSEFVTQAVNLGTMPADVGDAVKSATSTYTNYQQQEQQKEQSTGIFDWVMNLGRNLTKSK